MNIALQLLAAAAGACGFSLLFRVRRLNRILICSASGASVWAIYLLITLAGASMLLGNFLAAFAGTVLAEILARKLKSPATSFIAPAVIPLIPGGSLFYSMEHFVQGNRAAGGAQLMQTAAIAGVIAAGIYAASALFRFFGTHRKHSM